MLFRSFQFINRSPSIIFCSLGSALSRIFRFLKEIPAYLLERSVADTAHSRLATSELKFGDRVLHRKFGVGDVVAVTDDGLITVNFERAGTRLLSLKLAPLEKIE